MKRVSCLLVLVLLAGCKKPDANGMYADGTLAKGHAGIEGVVNEGDSDTPVSGVTVTIGDKKVKTDSDGKFVVFVPPGNYDVWFSKEGYQGNIPPYSAKPPDGMFWSMKVNLEKEPTPEELKEQANTEILNSLNIDDVTDRCGKSDNPFVPSVLVRVTYSNAFNTGPLMSTKYSSVDLYLHYATGREISSVDAYPNGSNHSVSISDRELVEILPCLLTGGVAK